MTTFEVILSLLSSIPEDSRNISHAGYMLLVVASVVMSIACSYLYLFFFDKNSTGSKVYRSFPLMGPAITCIFLTVQFSLPLSLGLLGALSIVRFRTPIKEPEEIGFILLLIAFALSIATFNLSFAVILYVIVFITLLILRKMKGFDTENVGFGMFHIEVLMAEQSSARIAEQVVRELNKKKLDCQIVAINQLEEVAFITLRIRNDKKLLVNMFDTVAEEFPTAKLNYSAT